MYLCINVIVSGEVENLPKLRTAAYALACTLWEDSLIVSGGWADLSSVEQLDLR